MNAEDDYLEINRESWNTSTEAGIHSDFYDLDVSKKNLVHTEQ
ncbi:MULTISPECIES: hypothetical protein [unclassified Sphingobacterium]|nr:hypothetical protein [Sphingobacterium sp. G1-14]